MRWEEKEKKKKEINKKTRLFIHHQLGKILLRVCSPLYFPRPADRT